MDDKYYVKTKFGVVEISADSWKEEQGLLVFMWGGRVSAVFKEWVFFNIQYSDISDAFGAFKEK